MQRSAICGSVRVLVLLAVCLTCLQLGNSLACNPSSELKLGLAYYFGKQGTTKNFKLAFVHFQNAAACNSAQAQFMLGEMYQEGHGVQQNFADARRWYEKAASNGSSQGMIRVARFLCTEHYYEQAQKLCEEAMQRCAPDSYSKTVLAWSLAGQGRLRDSLNLLYDACASAQNNTEKAFCYQIRAEVHENLGNAQEALKWYRFALQARPEHGNAKFWKDRILILTRVSIQSLHTSNFADRTPAWSKGWAPNSLMKVFVESSTSRFFNNKYGESIRAAFDCWRQDKEFLPEVEFVEKKENANVVISWTDKGDASMPRTNRRYNSHGHVVQARIIIPLLDPRSDVFAKKLRTTCLHEVGHALGIRGHSENPMDVMYDMFLFVFPTEPSARDKETLQLIYQR